MKEIIESLKNQPVGDGNIDMICPPFNIMKFIKACDERNVEIKGFSDIYFVTSKRSAMNGKATHFEANPKASVCYFLGGDSVTLIGNVEFIDDKEMQEAVWNETDRRFFKKGIEDPKFRLIKFHTIEATFLIESNPLTVLLIQSKITSVIIDWLKGLEISSFINKRPHGGK